jgi:uncharacterized protein
MMAEDLAQAAQSAADKQILDADKARAFDRLLAHLRAHPEVQNIELMNLADFCRNCLSQWLSEAQSARGAQLSKADARQYVYGMPYEQWQQRHQAPATPEQLARFAEREAQKRAASV